MRPAHSRGCRRHPHNPVDPDGFPGPFKSFLQPSLGRKGYPQIYMGLDEIGLKAQRLLELRDCLRHLVGFEQGVAEVTVGLGIIGPDPQGGFIFGDRIVKPPTWRRALPRL